MKVLLTESQVERLSERKLITEVNLMDIAHRTEKYMLPQYKEFISSKGLPNNAESVSLFLSQNGGHDTNWRVNLLKKLANAED